MFKNHTEETKRIISMKLKGRKKPTRTKQHIEKHRIKMIGKKMPPRSVMHLSRLSGENASNWKGGITKLNHLIRNCIEYRQWRADCFERDDYTCTACFKRGVYLEVDHIKMFSEIVKDNKILSLEDAKSCDELWNMNNGRTLCKICHNKVTFKK